MECEMTREGTSPPTVLHVLANSLPDLNGYAVRSHSILRSQNEQGVCNPVAITSPFYPDREAMRKPATIDGIRYLRSIDGTPVTKDTSSPTGPSGGRMAQRIRFVYRRVMRPLKWLIRDPVNLVRELSRMAGFRRTLLRTIDEEEPALVHGHTPFRVGMPALRATRRRGIPFVYEMRGIWEDSAVAQGRWKEGSLKYRYYRWMESRVLRNADHVVTISEQLRDEATRRGVDPSRITVVPNSVELTESNDELSVESETLRDSLEHALDGLTVVGYIGSLRALEGVDLTADAVAMLKAQGHPVAFLVLSGTTNQEALMDRCHSLGIEEISHIVGPVPHEDVGAFYRMIDVFVVSRPDTRVTRLVTPLKPLEAMSHGCATIVSDLPALNELVEDGRTGRTFQPDSERALAEVIERYITDPEEWQPIRTQGRAWVMNERCWKETVHRYTDVYTGLLS